MHVYVGEVVILFYYMYSTYDAVLLKCTYAHELMLTYSVCVFMGCWYITLTSSRFCVVLSPAMQCRCTSCIICNVFRHNR